MTPGFGWFQALRGVELEAMGDTPGRVLPPLEQSLLVANRDRYQAPHLGAQKQDLFYKQQHPKPDTNPLP